MMSYVIITWISLCVPIAPSSHRHDECQIWPGGLQQFTEAHLDLHSIIHRGDVTAHKVCGGAEGPRNQPKQLWCPHTVLHLCGWSLCLLPHLWIPAGNAGWNKLSSSETCTWANTHTHTHTRGKISWRNQVCPSERMWLFYMLCVSVRMYRYKQQI